MGPWHATSKYNTYRRPRQSVTNKPSQFPAVLLLGMFNRASMKSLNSSFLIWRHRLWMNILVKSIHTGTTRHAKLLSHRLLVHARTQIAHANPDTQRPLWQTQAHICTCYCPAKSLGYPPALGRTNIGAWLRRLTSTSPTMSTTQEKLQLIPAIVSWDWRGQGVPGIALPIRHSDILPW